MARWGLFLGFVFGTIALTAGGAALRWLDGAALWVGMGVFALFLWGAILAIRSFERTSG
jgi:hypothetical protein